MREMLQSKFSHDEHVLLKLHDLPVWHGMLTTRGHVLLMQAALAAVKRTVAATTSVGKRSEVAGATPAMRVARMQAASNFRALVSVAM